MLENVYPVLSYFLGLIVVGVGLYIFTTFRIWLFENHPYRGYAWAIRSQKGYIEDENKAWELIEEVWHEVQFDRKLNLPISPSRQLLVNYRYLNQLNRFSLSYSVVTAACFFILVFGIVVG